MEILSLMIVEQAGIRPNGNLDIAGGGGIFVSPPSLPNTYTAMVAGYAIQGPSDSNVEPLIMYLEHPGGASVNPLVQLDMTFVPAEDPWPGEPVSTAFVAPAKMTLFDEGVHHLVLVQRGIERRRMPFLVKLPD